MLCFIMNKTNLRRVFDRPEVQRISPDRRGRVPIPAPGDFRRRKFALRRDVIRDQHPSIAVEEIDVRIVFGFEKKTNKNNYSLVTNP